MPASEIKLEGSHNVENVMAATACGLIMGVGALDIREAVASFRVLEHRMEPVAAVGGVRFYNDSKATNPHATLKALSSFEQDVVLVMGGRNKGLDFSGLIDIVSKRLELESLKGVVLFGECSQELEKMIMERLGTRRESVVRVADIEDCVRKAFEMCAGKGTVLFSPACASFDMFTDYKDRGLAFKEQVTLIRRD